MLIPIAFGAAILSGLTWAFIRSKKVVGVTSNATPLANSIKKGITGQNVDDMVEVKLGDQTWLVAKNYIGPIGINEAAAMAKSVGMELPTPELVDAIWRQADLKLLPSPRNNVISQAVFDDQQRVIQNQIGGRPFTLLGGTFKDVVQVNGHPEIYGWHVEDGKTVAGVPLLKPVTPGPGRIIQPRSGSRHDQSGAIGFKDYSQGLRLVKRVS